MKFLRISILLNITFGMKEVDPIQGVRTLIWNKNGLEFKYNRNRIMHVIMFLESSIILSQQHFSVSI